MLRFLSLFFIFVSGFCDAAVYRCEIYKSLPHAPFTGWTENHEITTFPHDVVSTDKLNEARAICNNNFYRSWLEAFHNEAFPERAPWHVNDAVPNSSGISCTDKNGTSYGCGGFNVYLLSRDTERPRDCVGNPVDISTGSKYQVETDFSANMQDGLEFTRTYNSAFLTSNNWTFTYSQHLNLQGNTPSSSGARGVVYIGENGAETPFSKADANSQWYTYTNVPMVITEDAQNSLWSITFSDGKKEYFDATGKLSKVSYPSGIEHILSRLNNTTTVQDSRGFTLQITYSNGVPAALVTPDGDVISYQWSQMDYGSEGGNVDSLLESVTYPNSATKEYLYEKVGVPRLLTGIIDETNLRHNTWNYDFINGWKVTSSNVGGVESHTISYDTYSNSTYASDTNQLGRKTTYTYQLVNQKNVLQSIDGIASSSCLPSNSMVTYDSNGYLRTKSSSTGAVTETVRDAKGQITLKRRGLKWSSGVGSTLVENSDMESVETLWHANFAKPTQHIYHAKINGLWQDIKREDFVYDTHGRETSYTITDLTNYTVPYATNGRTRTTTTTYTYYDAAQTLIASKTVNGPLNPATQADGVDDITVYTYNNKSQLTQVQDAYSHITQYGDYLNRGLPQTVTDANGLVTHMTYTARGWLDTATLQTSQGNAVTKFDYYPNGLLQKTTLPDGSNLTYEYNAAHHLTAVSNNLGERIEYTPSPLDGKWTAQTVKDGMGQIVRTRQRVEDELGRIKKLLLADGNTDIENFYDGDDKLTSRNSRVGKKANAARVVSTQYGYDILERITATIDTMGEITEVDHDGSGDASRVTDARSNATVYLHDGFGDVIQQVSPDTGTTRYWYNALGQVKQKIDARNVTMTSTYDALGRKTADQYPSDTTLNVTYQYDQTIVQGENSEGIGRLAAALRTSANEYYTYDDRGNLTADIHSISGTVYRTRYGYNAASQLQSITYPSGRIISYLRDTLGRVAQINVQDGASAAVVPVVSNITYQPFGPISGFTYGNAIVDTRNFDQNGRLTDIIEKYGTTTIQNLGYAYDWAGNIELLTDRRSSTRTQTLSYDDVNRLLTASSGAYGAQTFTYDEVGNRLTGTTVSGSTTTTYTTTPVTTSNRLATVQRQVGTATPTSKAIVYDAAGNATTDFSRTLTYDAAGRLKSAKNGSVTLLALYNAQGQRISKWQSTAPTAAVHFHYDQRGQLISETSATGVTQRDYIWLDDIPVAILTGLSGSTVRNYIHSNYLHSPEVITDATRASIWRGDYAPYGSVTVGGAFVNNLRFPGQYLDAETGLSYNYFRDYDVVTGRYIESDPIGLGGGINTYAYVNSNPLKYFDFYGLDCEGTSSLGRAACNANALRDMANRRYAQACADGDDAAAEQADRDAENARNNYNCAVDRLNGGSCANSSNSSDSNHNNSNNSSQNNSNSSNHNNSNSSNRENQNEASNANEDVHNRHPDYTHYGDDAVNAMRQTNEVDVLGGMTPPNVYGP